MLIGHYAAAFAARRAAPALPLPLCFAACQLVDLFWGVLVLLGIEKLRIVPGFTASNGLDLYFMPYTHGLPAALAWSVGAAVLTWYFFPARTGRARVAVVIGLVVASHWLLDLLVHVPDLPLWFDGEKAGLGWWNYRVPALLLELALLWGALLACLGVMAEKRIRCLLLAGAMSAIQVMSLVAQPDQPVTMVMELLATHVALIGAAYWADRRASQRRMMPLAG